MSAKRPTLRLDVVTDVRLIWAQQLVKDLPERRIRVNREHIKYDPELARVVALKRAEKRRQISIRRRANFRKASGSFTREQWLELVKQYDHRCAYCHEQKPLTVDHVKALSRGGSNDIGNIVPACRSCNSRKGAK